MICTVWFGNGVLIPGIIITMALLGMVVFGIQMVILIVGYCVEALGILVQNFVVAPVAVGMKQRVV